MPGFYCSVDYHRILFFYRIVFCNCLFAGGTVTQQPRPYFYDIGTSGSIILLLWHVVKLVDEFRFLTLYFR